jgi:iron complex outermembrane receptor protein
MWSLEPLERPLKKHSFAIELASALALLGSASCLYAQNVAQEIIVIGITPSGDTLQSLKRIPFAVHSAAYGELEAAQSLDLSDYLNSRMASVNINSAQNNPLQADLQYRGFTASPLLGLPQGLSVYQNGVRINEPLGDAVNWDLVPESAIYRLDLVSGANPVFGLNTLGGALAIKMKDGFNFPQQSISASTGSWGRNTATLESGANNGEWGYYLNLSHFSEDGWRRQSSSESLNLYSALGWRPTEQSAADLVYQRGDSNLIGNGALPVGLAKQARNSVFTAPDITDNAMQMLALSAHHKIRPELEISTNLYWRDNLTHSFNGDSSDFERCDFAGGEQALFEEVDEIEDALEDSLDLSLDAICTGADPRFRSYSDLANDIESRALAAGLAPQDFEIENVTDGLSGTGILADAAINNRSQRRQRSRGFGIQATSTEPWAGRPNQLIGGISAHLGDSRFHSTLELAQLDPFTRSTMGLGVGTYFDAAATHIRTNTDTYSVFLTDTVELDPRWALTLSARYNLSKVTLRDSSGERPELNGRHRFARINPAIGITWNPIETLTLYGSYSEANRVPTPIELACNEGVFELAQAFALAAGEDPEDVEFECRLPNAFLADPPLNDVVTKSLEVGLRGDWLSAKYQVSLFRARNQDDILFQTTGRSTGLFANVDATVRRGLEFSVQQRLGDWQWLGSYSYVQARFDDHFLALSPNHPDANSDGEIAVSPSDRLPGLPEHIAKLSVDYAINQALSIGAELVYNGSQVLRGDESNALSKVDAASIVNAQASYLLGPRFSVFVKLSNVLNREYENFGLLGEDPSEVIPELLDNRPLFLGIGAPRAAWLGAKLQF